MRDRRIIINADDFGFSLGVNRAIIQAHEQGILTSTSLMVTADAAQDAIALARTHPNLAVGLHLVLGCGRSALPPADIPHLVNPSGQFPDSGLQAGLRYQFNRAARQELRREIRAQLEKFQQTGLPLSHVDGHLHLHMHPVVLTILAELATEFQIPAIRLPYEELGLTLAIDRQGWLEKIIAAGIFGGLRLYGEPLMRRHSIQFIDRVYGLLQTGQITADYLCKLIQHTQADRIEIYCHPALPQPGEPLNGPPGSGEAELAALLSPTVREALHRQGFELATYPSLR